MSDEKQLLGARIKELRKNKGLTQQQLAELIDIDSKHLSKIEVGSSYPSLYNLEKITKVLNIKMQDLFNFEHHKNKEILIADITELLNSADEKSLKIAYKILHSIIPN